MEVKDQILSQVGEMFLVGFQGPEIPLWVRTFAQKHSLGAVILFDYSVQTKTYQNNVVSKEQVQKLCAEISALPSKPMVFVDQEGGKVRRLKEKLGFTPFPSHWNFNKLSRDEKKIVLDKVFRELKELHISFDMAPVIDMNINPANPDIGAVERSYSDVPADIYENTQLMAEAAKKYGIGLTLKHFPGLGGAKVNSHEELTDISDTILEEQLELFRKGLEIIPGKGVVVSHGLVKQWDSKPMSLSPHAAKMLRRWDEDALLITDDLHMSGLQKLFKTPEACELAFAAGMDMLCIGNNLMNEEQLCEKLPEVLANKIVAGGDASVQQFNKTRQRILRCKSL